MLADTAAMVPVYDSFGDPGTRPEQSPLARPPFAYLQGVYHGCFNIYDGSRKFRGSTKQDTRPCNANADAVPGPGLIEYQGRGCMATRNLLGSVHRRPRPRHRHARRVSTYHRGSQRVRRSEQEGNG